MHAIPLKFDRDTVRAPAAENPCVARFLEHCHRRKYPAKSVIIYAGDTPDVLYYIVKGSVTVLMEDDDGHEIVLAYINAGGFFGEMGLFGEQPNRSAWVRTRSECEVAEISYSRFRALAKEDPDILLELCKEPDAMTHPDGMQIRITRQEIGRIVGCSREMAGRVLKALAEQGHISVKGKTIVVFGTR